MFTYKLFVGVFMASLVLMLTLGTTIPGDVQGATLYKYTDKDGSLILTDNPPPGVQVEEYIAPDNSMPDVKAAPEIDMDAKMKAIQEAETKRQEKQKKIETLRAELAKAISDEQAYRRNMNQASGFSQRRHWRLLVDEQLTLIEEKKKQIDELESGRP